MAEMVVQNKVQEMLRQQAKPNILPAVLHHIKHYGDCKLCDLGTHCMLNNHVFYRGQIPAKVLFIGEAPGESEDTFGKPFVGPAGRMLNEIIEESFALSFDQSEWGTGFTWCITNVVCCIPRNLQPNATEATRPPSPPEIRACSARLRSFIGLVQPQIIVTMGDVAKRGTPQGLRLTNFPATLQQLRGVEPYDEWFPQYVDIRHPSYVIRQKSESLRELEKKRAVLILKNAYDKFLSPIPF